MTPESARRLLALKADPDPQARVDLLAGRSNQGLLTPEEQVEYGNYVTFAHSSPFSSPKSANFSPISNSDKS